MVTTVIGSRFITYAYDRLNRLATVSEGSTQTTYTYNTLGSRSRTTTRLNGALVTTTAYAYNIAGLPTAIANYGSDNLIVSSFSYTYRGEPKERNPKLLPIGDGFGFLLFFGDLS